MLRERWRLPSDLFCLDCCVDCFIMNSTVDNDLPFKHRTIPVQNIALRLRNREVNSTSKSSSIFTSTRRFFQNVTPNYTCINIEKPACFIRKFTPDGSHLIAFSSDQTSVEIYEYQGPSSAAHLFHDLPVEPGGDCTLTGSKEVEIIRRSLFDLMFKLKHTVHVTVENEQLNRECSLFTDDSKYVVVGSASFVPDESQLHYFDVYRNNESVSLNSRVPLENYSIHLIDIKYGKCCDKRSFRTDKIFLSHNQGLHLYKKTLSVLSVQHQLIHLFHVITDPLSGEGKFFDVKTVGRFCYEDDEFLVTSVQAKEQKVNPHLRSHQATIRPFRETSINCLKHRLLVHLYKESITQCSPSTTLPLQKFFQNFERYRSLKMWKMQLLDEHNLLIKYANEEVITRLNESSPPSYFVVYNFVSTEVIAVYDNSSAEFLNIFETFCDHFRNAHLTSSWQLTCSPSNNNCSKVIQQRFKQTMINARNGGMTEAVKRLLAQLPISAQSFCPSPYLDLSLFSYDDKWISVLERPKACSDYPVKFFSRDSGLLRFRIHAGLETRNRDIQPSNGGRRLVAFTFHPFDPLAISVQRTNSDYVVNIHLRNEAVDLLKTE